jgi:hypothetical protein
MKGCAFLFMALILNMTKEPNSPIAHVRNRFEFVVQAPLHRAAPLFGPEGERCWAGKDWNPEFLYPQPGSDVEGAVFTVQHGSHTSVWVNTLFDLAGGRMQYVSFLVGSVVSTVDVRLTSLDSSSTRVEVTYVRTALNAAANEDVRAMGVSDRESGPHWQQAIEQCLAGR